MLSKTEFLVLCQYEKSLKKLTQRELASKIDMSVGSVNKTIKVLEENGLIADDAITDKGRSALEPYRVKRAIFIAAGFGSRLVPLTLNTPKPLIRVHGKRMIEYTLEAVVEAGIEEIIIVRGYLGEQFDNLLKKYPNIKFIDNPMYNEANNISSVFLAKELLRNSYICEADLVLSNKNLITKYQYSSNYLGVPVTVTDDWCFKTTNGVVTKMSIGGQNCFQMIGISYWTDEDGKQLATDVEKTFLAPGGKERYWDQVPLEYHIKNYKVEVRPCTFDDIIEIDSFAELKKIDKLYN